MRTAELLSALSLGMGGVSLHMDKDGVIVWTNYAPTLQGCEDTPMKALVKLAEEILADSSCPPEVRQALETYDMVTEFLRL